MYILKNLEKSITLYALYDRKYIRDFRIGHLSNSLR